MKIPLFILAAMILTSCASTALSPAGGHVLIVQSMSVSEMQGYRNLGSLTCEHGWNFRRAFTNVNSCKNELRNETADMGGSVFLIETWLVGANGCANCVEMEGSALAPK